MWERYRKTALVTQSFIFGSCALVYLFAKHEPLEFILTAFAMMQVGAIFGAYWSTRLVRKMQDDSEKAKKKR